MSERRGIPAEPVRGSGRPGRRALPPTRRRRPGRVVLRGLAVAVAASVLAAVGPAVVQEAPQVARVPPTSPTPSATTPPTPAELLSAENARAGTRAWREPAATRAGDRELAGFASTPSALPGERVGLYVQSTLGRWTATAYRMGWYGGRGGREVWRSKSRAAQPQPAAQLLPGNAVYCPWKAGLTIDTTGWLEGGYLIVLRAGGKWKYIPLTLRSATTAGRLVLVHATATYQAYNQWGGYSLYKGPGGAAQQRATKVSFHRPYDKSGAEKFVSFDMVATQRAERLGLSLAWLTSADLEAPGALRGAVGVVSLGHDEYWSVPMRAAVTAARDAGANIAFLGGNAVYWRIRFDDKGQSIVAYKSPTADPVRGPTTTAKWRQAPGAEPESSLVGMLYECFPANGAFVVKTPSFFLFKGTGVQAGTTFPGLNNDETDRAYPGAGTPASLQVVAHSPIRCGRKPALTYADMTYYTVPSGAGVVATGTMAWVWALRGPAPSRGIDAAGVRFARTVTDTLLREMASGRLGKAHPSKPNLDAIAPNPSTLTGTGGAVSPG